MARIGIFFLLAAALLTGLWALLRPIAAVAPAAQPVAAVSATPDAAANALPTPDVARVETAIVAAPKRFELRPGMAEPTVMQVQAGDEVELSITTTSDDELHLHGYDLELALHAGQPATLRFVAEHAGRFELELHHAHVELGVLEVQPR